MGLMTCSFGEMASPNIDRADPFFSELHKQASFLMNLLPFKTD